jgi:transposase InsO family protein
VVRVMATTIRSVGAASQEGSERGSLLCSGRRDHIVIGQTEGHADQASAEESGLYGQRASLRALVQCAEPSLGHWQSAILREAFEEAYARAGITDNDPQTWSRPVPTFGGVQEVLAEWVEDDGGCQDHPRRDDGGAGQGSAGDRPPWLTAATWHDHRAMLLGHWFLPLAYAQEKLDACRSFYNEERPHGAFGHKPPISLQNPGGASSLPP